MSHAQTQNDTLIAPENVDIQDLQAQRDAQQDPHARLYAQAKAIGDWHTALSAAHLLLLKDPTQTYLKDTITALYVRTGNSQAMRAWSAKVSKEHPDNEFSTAIYAQVCANNQDYSESIQAFSRLWKLTGKPYYLYQTAANEFVLRRDGESETHTQEMLGIVAGSKELVLLRDQDGAQEVLLEAAAWNLLGNLKNRAGKPKEAKDCFTKALQLQPDFRLARSNLKDAGGKAPK